MRWMKSFLRRIVGEERGRAFGLRELFRYIGPGLLVTVGFIDPGNWASNVEAGSRFGYDLLWVISLSTVMLIFLQHNVAHLGIVTGNCLSEAATAYLPRWISVPAVGSAMAVSVATSLAEILGGAIALQMLFEIPIPVGSLIVVAGVMVILFLNSYRKLERWLVGFVSIIGFSFLYELSLVHIEWGAAFRGWVLPSIPGGNAAQSQQAMIVVMSLLGAVVMPHNLFLHSEIIQSRQWNLEDEQTMRKQLKYEFADTLFAMLVGWAINSAMILLACAAFFRTGQAVSELSQAHSLLDPILGKGAATVFALALLFSGFSSTVTSAIAGGSIFSGFFGEPFHIRDKHTRAGIYLSLLGALFVIFFIRDTFRGLILSQMVLSIQLPITVFLQIYLTSSKRVMGSYRNSPLIVVFLLSLGGIVTYLNLRLLAEFFGQ